jgi:hypothetical protein
MTSTSCTSSSSTNPAVLSSPDLSSPCRRPAVRCGTTLLFFLLGPFRGDEPASAALVQGESIAEFVEQLVSIYGTEDTFLQEGYSE